MFSRRIVPVTVAALALLAGAPVGLAQDSQPGQPAKPAQPAQPAKPAQPQQPKWQIGKPAPAFTLTDLDGKEHALANHFGEVVVIVWWNPTCAEVRHQFTEGPMKNIASAFANQPVTWLTVNSTPEGQDGGGKAASLKGRTDLAMTMPILLDSTGAVAKAYQVEKAPTAFVINEEGVLVYAGAIDNAPNGKLADGAKPASYLRDAVRATLEGQTIGTATTQPYGCPITAPKPRG